MADEWDEELEVSDYEGDEDSAVEDGELDPHEEAFMEGYEEADNIDSDDGSNSDEDPV